MSSSAASTSAATLSSEPNANTIEIISDSSAGGFEGPEKLLEIWVAPSSEHIERKGLEIKGTRENKVGAKSRHGLRQVDRSVWDKMLDEVQCKVLSVIEGDEVDAYLLSESSMFVWPHKVILKTCGTTTLLLGLPTLLRIASEICGLHSVHRCFYSRKTFMFPDRQRGPHKDWTQEMGFLDKLFDNSSAYTVGKMNGDHWLLYLTPPQNEESFASPPVESAPASPTITSSLIHTISTSLLSAIPLSLLPPLMQSRSRSAISAAAPDQTLEILMSRLDPSVCASFYHPSSSSSSSTYTSPLFANDPSDADAHALGSSLSDRLGLTALLPRATIDSFLFSPCGFSSNAVQGDRYATIHVTPEVAYSYASYETNVTFGEEGRIGSTVANRRTSLIGGKQNAGVSADASATTLATGEPKNVQELVEKVLAVFKPAKFSITLFISMDDAGTGTSSVPSTSRRDIVMSTALVEEKYKLVDRIVYEFEGYSLLYIVYEAKVAHTIDEVI